MKNLSIISIIFLFITAGCGENKQATDGIITIDVTAKYPKKELILQDFMDVEYIPLESSDDFITMAYIQAIGKELLIVRNRNRSSDGDIFIFDRSGKGLRKINRSGQGAEEYLFLLGIVLDEENNELFVNDRDSRKIFVYDLFGKFKRSFAHKENIFYDQVDNFDSEHLICHDGSNPFGETVRNTFLIISKQDGSIKEIQIPYEERKSTMLRFVDEANSMTIVYGARNQELIPYGDSWILVEPSSDTIYKYRPDYSMEPFIARTPSIQSMSPEIFLFPGVLTDRYYFMQTVKREFNINTEEGFPRTNLVYDRQEKTIAECTVYNGDYSNEKPINLVYEITLMNNEIAFLQKLEAYELVEAHKEGKLNGKLKEIASNLDEDSNPVILLAKQKTNN